MAEQAPRQRRAARIILIDESGLALLFRGGDPGRPEAGTWWFTPGGAVEPGESAEDSARRELREETGLDAPDLGPIVLRRQLEHEFEAVRYFQEEVYFLVRCDHFDISDSGWTETERRVVEEHRWWSVAELRATADTVYPEGLVAFLDGLRGP
ncbi:MAG: NUDIX hydrolase [Candidatus Dormibacteria bacterium]